MDVKPPAMESQPPSQEKPPAAPVEPPAPPPAARGPSLSFSKPPPGDLYRRLLPAALFLLTFVTVMTILLMYMDTTALRAQQFRMNMSHEYNLQRIAQDDPFFVAYVRQLHVKPGRRAAAAAAAAAQAETPARAAGWLSVFNNKRNGTFVEILTSGPRDGVTSLLERARGWRGLAVRADPRDYLALRTEPGSLTLHACLSLQAHPKEVTYYDSSDTVQQDGVSVDALNSDWSGSGFTPRVLCYPLYTMLLASGLTRCDYLLLGCEGSLLALATLPFHKVDIQVIEVRMPMDATRYKTTEFLRANHYKVLAEYEDAVLYEKSAEPASEA